MPTTAAAKVIPLASSPSAIRALLRQRFPDAVPVPEDENAWQREPVPLGVEGLERVFPTGGLPRGRVTAWLPQGASGAILRAACQATVATSERAAWVCQGEHVGAQWDVGPLLVRATSRLNVLRWGEGLARCGGFALVVVESAAAQGPEMVRLSRAAHEGGTALVVLTERAATAALRVTSHIIPRKYHWQPGPFGSPAAVLSATVEVGVLAGGWHRQTEITLPIVPFEWPLTTNPHLVDRRGVNR